MGLFHNRHLHVEQEEDEGELNTYKTSMFANVISKPQDMFVWQSPKEKPHHYDCHNSFAMTLKIVMKKSYITITGRAQSQTFERNKHPVEPDSDLIWSSLLTREEFNKWIYLHCCLSTWLQQLPAGVTSIVVCLCTAMLTADCSWRQHLLNCTNVALEKRERKRRERTSVSGECWVWWLTWTQT